MIEVRSEPSRCRVAGLACRWKACRDVVRIFGVVEVGLMAAHAVGRRSLVLPVDVTLRTSHSPVRSGQWESSG